MSTATDGLVLNFETTPIPDDAAPPMDEPTPVAAPFNPEFPDSTADAPYGYFPDGRIRKRRPHGSRKTATSSVTRMPASESSARSAAGLLATLNNLIAVGITTAAGLPRTGAAITEGNAQFESMAYEALLADPALCKKILSVGASSGKGALALAYVTLGATIVPAAISEVKERKAELND